jgi:hypothetical protein
MKCDVYGAIAFPASVLQQSKESKLPSRCWFLLDQKAVRIYDYHGSVRWGLSSASPFPVVEAD